MRKASVVEQHLSEGRTGPMFARALAAIALSSLWIESANAQCLQFEKTFSGSVAEQIRAMTSDGSNAVFVGHLGAADPLPSLDT